MHETSSALTSVVVGCGWLRGTHQFLTHNGDRRRGADTQFDALAFYVDYCHANGLAATARFSLGTDRVDELMKLAEEIQLEFPNSLFFTSKLVFRNENWVTRLLHNQTALALQRRLHLNGMQMVILPMQL